MNFEKVAFPSQYSMSFPGIDDEVLCILVFIKLRIVDDTDKGHYICDVLDYNTVAWWNWDDATITQYSGYPMNIYMIIYRLIMSKKKENSYPVWIIQDYVNVIYLKKHSYIEHLLFYYREISIQRDGTY